MTDREARLAQRRKRREGWIRAYLGGAEPTPPEAPPEPARCVWKESEFGSWDTGCGRCFEFYEGYPAFTNVRFCFYCGQPLVVEGHP